MLALPMAKSAVVLTAYKDASAAVKISDAHPGRKHNRKDKVIIAYTFFK